MSVTDEDLVESVPVRARLLEVAYVVMTGTWMWLAVADPNRIRPLLFVTALVLCLPAMVVGLPFLYLAGGLAWNLSDADNGGPRWPVTLTYVVMELVIAVANVFLVRLLLDRRAAARTPLS
jgi:hypothetical protein